MVPSIQASAVQKAVERLDHPSADEVFMHVRKNHPRVSIGTVYRNLDRLVREGELRMRHIGGQRRYDTRLEPHAHLHCLHCDRLHDVPWDAAGIEHIHKHAETHSFKVEDHLLEVQGVCEECQQKGASTASPSKSE